ncbi:MAG: nuclear transport factor 2 family protein [Vicinamibacteria bacterium]
MTHPSRRSAVAGLLALPLAAHAAAMPSSSEAELLKVREGAWRDWFGGNRRELMALLPEDFVGIGAGGGAGQSRAETIAPSEAFAAAGGKLTNLAFNDNRIQRIESVAVIYCGFTFTTTDKAAVTNAVTGRATEVFFWSGKAWSHPSWHPDSGR